MAGRQNDKWVLKTYGYDVAQLYQTLYSISGHPIEQKRRLLLVEGPDDKKFYEQFANREQFIKELDRKQCLKLYGEYKRITDKINY